MPKSDKKRRASELEPAAAAAPVVASESAIQPGPTAMDVDGADEPAKAKREKKEKKKEKKQKSKADKAVEGIVKAAEAGDESAFDVDALSPIAHPLADKKVSKKVLRTVRKASKQRYIKRGVKEVVKALRKGEKGVVVMAADISPVDVLSHIPVLAEDAGCPYIFVPTKESLGIASSTKRPTSCVMIQAESGGSAAAKKRLAEKKAAAAAADPAKAKVQAEEEAEYKSAYSSVLKEVAELDERIEY